MLTDCYKHILVYHPYIEVILENGEILTMDLCSIVEKCIDGNICCCAKYNCPKGNWRGYSLRKTDKNYILSCDDKQISFNALCEITAECYETKNPGEPLKHEIAFFDINDNMRYKFLKQLIDKNGEFILQDDNKSLLLC